MLTHTFVVCSLGDNQIGDAAKVAIRAAWGNRDDDDDDDDDDSYLSL